MTDKFNKRKKNFLALLLSLLMVSSTAVSFVACNQETDDETNDDTTTSTVETDTARINNGSFEFVDTEDKTTLIYTSPTGWSKDTSGTSAASSSAKSGIVNVEENAWKNFTQSALVGVDAPETAEAAKASWDSMSAFDKLTFYKAWEDADHDEDVEDLDFYDADTDDFNVDIDDVPAFEVNPGVHTGATDGDTHVFMIHNSRTNGLGTAQKYASSTTVTVEANTSAKFSLWVKTADLTFADGSPVVDGKMGAYIGVTHTVGGTTLDQFQVKNIVADEWTQYEFYLRGCSFATSTFKIVLGLGQGGGSQVSEYVQGYAFFDDVTCSLIDNAAYKAATDGIIAPNETATLADEGPEKQFDVGKHGANVGKTKFALDLYADFASYTVADGDFTRGLTVQKKDGKNYVSGTGKYQQSGQTVPQTLNGGFSTDDDVVELLTPTALKTAAASNTYLKNRLEKDFGFDGTDFSDKYNALFGNSQVLMMLSAKGANYTAEIKDADFTLAKGQRMGISFFLKTSDLKGRTGVTVTARNNDLQSEKATLSSLTTTGVTKVDLEDGQEDVFDGWQQVFVFVENDTDKANLSFTLEISFGPAEVDVAKDSYYAGYAAMTGFRWATDMSEAEYGYASTGTYATKLSLSDPNADDFTGIQFDSAAVVPTNALENGLAWLRNYKGVFANSGYVSGTGTNNVVNDDTPEEANEYQYAGLFSKDYIETYAENTDANYWLNQIKDVAAMSKAEKVGFLQGLLGTGSEEATQPLIIVNNEAKSYGFIGATTALTANGYKSVSVRVKVSAGATATVYLTDTDDLTHETVTGISRQVSYWYDKDGNVCVSDPTAATGFNPKTDVAFKLQSNGLYKANDAWAGYGALTAEQKNAYFANLANYERETNDDGSVNLLVAEGGVQYNYNGEWDGEGMDGVAYYGDAQGNFYADRAKTVKVLDFDVSGLAPRYTATTSEKQLAVEVTDTNGAWETVTFHLHAGVTAKNFRLEVWNGNRDGDTNPKGSYVLFDGNQVDDSTDETWTDRMDGVISEVLDANDWTDEEFKENYADVLYNAYSFYDSAKFLRYNADLDENELTSSYDDFDPTDKTLYTEIVSYMRADLDGATTVFLDYAQTDKDVAVDVEPSEDEDEDDDTTDTTNDDGMNVWLLISSLVIAIALIVAVVALILRKAFAKARRAKARAAAAHPASVRKPTSAKKVKADKPAKKDQPKDDGDPYND